MKILAVFAIFVISLLLISGCVDSSKDTPLKTIKSDLGQDSQNKIAMRVHIGWGKPRSGRKDQ